MKLQVLISALEKDAAQLSKKMNIHSDALIVNQCDKYDYLAFEQDGHCIRCLSMPQRGVGLSRNTALLQADVDTDICLFSDEDIVLKSDYEAQIKKAYEELPQADMILVNVKVAKERKTYWNEDVHRVGYLNYGRYPAYSITARLSSLRKANVSFSLLFGGGAKYSNGEDSLFLRDCLKAGLKIYTHTICVGEEIPRPSTWFHGYNEKFFVDRGVLYHYLYGKLSYVLALRFLITHRKEMCCEIPVGKAYALMKAGILEGKKR